MKSTFTYIVITFVLAIQTFVVCAQKKNPINSYQIQKEISNVKNPSFLLNGNWLFQYEKREKWYDVKVPCELAMQGFAIEHDKPYLYKKSFRIPSDYKGNRVILRFDGVYSHAKLYINGKFIRGHKGGFTRWETDVTSYVKIGGKNEIKMEIIDPIAEISYGSGYAHHPIGGILRDVVILAQPKSHLTNFYIETDLDDKYEDAVLKVGYDANNVDASQMSIKLFDPSGKKVNLSKSTFDLVKGESLQEVPIENPLKWDAEHPNLYTLNIEIKSAGKKISSFSKRIGFREVKVSGDQLLVNGVPVKLRGANRHDVHPELGRGMTRDIDSLDAVLFKESNMNYARTSHYPPTEAFVDFCDELGIYVECETAVCFVGTHRQRNYHASSFLQDSIIYLDQYLTQCEEMIKTFRSNSSVVIWSIGNENIYGKNFQASWDYVKGIDTTRPVMFSYPGAVKQKEKPYDILSMHYQDASGNLNQWGVETRNFQHAGIPVIFDEWAHPACYTYKTLQDDPNIREFWGKSLDMMWGGLYPTQGGLGGAIWGYVDDLFMLPEPKVGKKWWTDFARSAKPDGMQGNCVGYGEWGIVDVWRRKKPEFWATKKAYSPVKVINTTIKNVVSGQPIALALYNRFDHTNLNEVKLQYIYNGETKTISIPTIPPREKGFVSIPGMNWKSGDQLEVSFIASDNTIIDTEHISLGNKPKEILKGERNGGLEIVENSSQIIVKGDGFEIPFDKNDGLITNATADGKVFIEKGPFLHLEINLNHLSGAEVRKRARSILTSSSDWKKKDLSVKKQNDKVIAILTGSYQDIMVSIHMTISSKGEMDIAYELDGQPNGYIRETGLKFDVPERYNWLSWDRKGYWTCYPKGAFAGNQESVSMYSGVKMEYGKRPNQAWGQDAHNFFYWSDKGANTENPITQQAKGMKENIYCYTLSEEDHLKGSFNVVSRDASIACRVSKEASGNLMLHINNQWDYPEIAWGNYCKIIEAVPCFGSIKIMF